MNLFDHLKSARKSLFRFEALQTYDVSNEEQAFEDFLATGTIDTSQNQDWYDFLEGKHQEGVITQRVRLIELPLTDYTRFELPSHYEAIKYGDDIRAITKEAFSVLSIPLQDFWLIDDQIILLMNYDESGKWLGFNQVDEPEKYSAYRDQLLTYATELDSDK